MVLVAMTIPSGANTSDLLDADKVMDRYFAALQDGDVNALRSLLGGDLLGKRLRLLQNPTYPQYLRTTYQATTFTIVESVSVAPNKVSIHAKFDFQNQPPLLRKFILVRENAKKDAQFRIHSESSP